MSYFYMYPGLTRSYGKGYENDSTITNGWGITMAVYRCKGSPEPNVTPKKIKVK